VWDNQHRGCGIFDYESKRKIQYKAGVEKVEKYQLKKDRWFVKWEDYQALMKKCGSGDLRRVELSGQETYDKLKSIIGYDPNRLTALCSGVLNPNVLYEEQSNSNFTGSLGGICV
jgi:hypothetical protein